MTTFKKGDNNKWYYRFQLNGKEFYRACKGATNKKEADMYEAIVKSELMKGNLGIIENTQKATLNEGVALYLEYSKLNKKSFANDNSYTNAFISFFKGGTLLDDISPSDIEAFKSWLLEKDLSKSTVNRYTQALSKMFNVAISNKKTKNNPVREVKQLKTENHAIRFLTKIEERKFFRALPKFYFKNIQKCSKIKLLVFFALKTGARKEEIFGIKWENIDFKKNEIELLYTKSNKKRVIPLAKSLKKILLKLKKYNESEYVFINPATGKRYVDVKKIFKSAVEKAEIKHLRFHDLRHTFATRLIEKGVDIVVVKELLGHASITTTMIYVHSDAERKQNAIDVIDNY